MKIKLNIKSIILMSAIVLASMLFINISFAADTGKVTVETAKLRSKASTDSQVLDLVSKDEKVDILSEDNNWYKVKYKTTTGYIRKDLVQVENKESSSNVTNENTTKNTINNTINNTTENTQVANETKEENKSSENSANETNNVAEQSTETLNIEKNSKYKLKENVKIKVIPLISSIELDEVKKDDEVEVVEILNDWVKVRLSNQKEGWIRKDKLTNIQTETAKVENTENTENTTTSRDEQQLTSRGSTTSRDETTKNTKSTAKTTVAKSTKTKTTAKTSTSTVATTSKTIAESTSTSASGNAVATYAKQYVGCKYVRGGTSPSGFDCSGFTTYVYKHFGVTLSRTAAGQYGNGKAVTSLQAGDLVMFSYGKGISHVGIYIGGNQFVHAANSRSGVRIDSLSGSYKSRFVGARRIF